MEYFYWLGYKIAFGLEIFSIIFGLSYLNSIRAKNLEKVGLYYSIYKGNFVEGKKPSVFGTIFGIISMLIINPLLSWITVVVRLYAYINLLWQKISTPEKIKEIQYKLGATILNKEEVKQLIQESSFFLGKKVEFEDDLLDLDSYEIRIDKKNNQYVAYARNLDYDTLKYCDYWDTYEYKIKGHIVYRKLIESKRKEGLIKTSKENDSSLIYYDVKKGIVLEDDIIARGNGSISIKENIKRLKELTKKFEEIDDYNIKYFILSKYPENNPIKYFQSELKNIELCMSKAKELCDKCEVTLEYDDEDEFSEFKKRMEILKGYLKEVSIK
ncbi:MAG: hypothetical protein WCO66_05020 [Candidatus Absconditabacteria bacterium]